MRYALAATLLYVSFLGDASAQMASTDIFVQLATIDNAPSSAPVFRTKETVEAAVENCAKQSVKTEFDTAQSTIERIAKAPCKFVGISTIRGRSDEILGDILKYDPEAQIASWVIQTTIGDNLRYGQIALPYDLPTVMEKKDLPANQQAEVKRLSGTSFVFLPLSGGKDETSIYEASNGFGAKVSVLSLKGTRTAIAFDTGRQYVLGPLTIASIPLTREKAADLVPNLDLKIYWTATKPCDDCLAGGRLLTGTPGGPTFNNPHDVRLAETYVFAKFAAIRFVDRRDGKTYAIYSEGKVFPAKD